MIFRFVKASQSLRLLLGKVYKQLSWRGRRPSAALLLIVAMAQFAGKWKVDKCDNMDGFMKAMGAPEELIKKALEAKDKEVIEFTVNGNTFNVKSEVMKFNHTFELGKEFEETGPTGKKSKNIVKLEGDKLITDSKLEDGKELHMERWIEGNRLIVEMKSAGATARHEFVKI